MSVNHRSEQHGEMFLKVASDTQMLAVVNSCLSELKAHSTGGYIMPTNRNLVNYLRLVRSWILEENLLVVLLYKTGIIPNFILKFILILSVVWL